MDGELQSVKIKRPRYTQEDQRRNVPPGPSSASTQAAWARSPGAAPQWAPGAGRAEDGRVPWSGENTAASKTWGTLLLPGATIYSLAKVGARTYLPHGV